MRQPLELHATHIRSHDLIAHERDVLLLHLFLLPLQLPHASCLSRRQSRGFWGLSWHHFRPHRWAESAGLCLIREQVEAADLEARRRGVLEVETMCQACW